jgi:pyrroloquinoline quinone biosynthesis protein B
MRVKVLGSAAGGGFPQWNCACRNCLRARQGELRGASRTQTQIAVALSDTAWLLLNASPDLRSQIEATPELHPRSSWQGGCRNTPVAGVVLTSADLDHVLGLLLLREFQSLAVYATRSLRSILTGENTCFGVLERETGQAVWRDICPGQPFDVPLADGRASGIRCEPLTVSGAYPEYVSADRRRSLPASEAVIALVVEDTASRARMLFAPGLPRVDEIILRRAAECDLLLLDGTFWSNEELIGVRGRGRTALEMGHVPIGGENGTLRQLTHLRRPRKVYIHINNTNPILDEQSAEFAEVTAAGWSVAHDAMEFTL